MPATMTHRRFVPVLAAVLCAVFQLVPAALAQRGAEPIQPKTQRTKHYDFTHDLDAETARDVADHMDAVFDEYARRMSSFKVRNAKQVKLYVWADRETYIAFLAERGVEGAQYTGGLFFVQGGEAGLTTFVNGQSRAAMFHTLQHEGFHQFAHLRVGNLPPWANEGLAEYFGHGILINGKLITGIAPSTRITAMQEAATAKEHFPLAVLVNMDSATWNGILQSGDPRAQTMYTQAWAVSHFLVKADGGKYADAFQRYLEQLAASRSHFEAFKTAFGTSDVEGFETKWLAYLAEMEPDDLSEAQQRLDFLGEGLRALHERSVPVASLADLKRELQARGFEVVRRGHGGAEVLSAEDDAMFLAPGQSAEAAADGAPAADQPAPEPDNSRRKARPGPTRRPARERQKVEPAIEFIASTDPALPATLRIVGLRAPARLEWLRAPDGSLTHEVKFE